MSDLVPIIVQDASSGDVLMLGYGNEDSMRLSEETGFVHFWSRSRRTLWKKGETSGNTLRIVSSTWDCDRDTLLITADPAGPTCHTGANSCFTGAQAPAAATWHTLEHTISQRRADRPDGSYTVALLDGGTDASARKVIEEAGEVAFAAKDGNAGRVTEEAADLIYHLLVLLADQGVTLDQVGAVLGRRAG